MALYIYYIVLIFYSIQLIVALVNFITKPLLIYNNDNNLNDFISLLIPARNEEKNISNILDSILLEDYKNFEIIVLNDSSTDKTEDILKLYIQKDSKIRYLSGKELPEGWLGKNWACHQLADQAKGKYLLFLDADTIIERGTINSSLNYLKNNDLKLLSLFPDQIMLTLGEKLTVPLMHNILLSLLPLLSIKNTKYSSLAAANGQFMFFDAENYKINQWHQLAKKEITEDIKIIRLMKIKGYKTMTLLGNNLVKCRMYQSLEESINGFSKNIILMLGGSITFLFIYLAFMSWIWIYLIFNFSFFNLVPIILIVITQRTLISYISNQNLLDNLIFYPIQIILLNFISFLSLYKKISKKQTWKGRKI